MADPSDRPASPRSDLDVAAIKRNVRAWAGELGFTGIGFAGTDLQEYETRLMNWLGDGRHGEMGYMERHGTLRSRPAALVPGTASVISVRMDYLPPDGHAPTSVLDKPGLGYVSRYALGRDYHKVIRNRLQRLARRMEATVGPFGYRAFADSAPVLEKAIAQQAGLGWIGKHTNLLTREAGSWFFLGELYTSLPIPADTAGNDHCGSCQACIDICPTRAITAPYHLDARRCISYLTIELRGTIPEKFRAAIGNRIYGCDDCQLVCPWNRFARTSPLPDFAIRNGLDAPELTGLFAWEEDEFLRRTEGSAIRRIGHECWLRNIAVALGNTETTPNVVDALRARESHPSPLVREHVQWALARQGT
ncbi:MAG: tRNA epoxyqueuosine(34) reductase QueG [Pseudomonadota bacterium]|nr:tRNA epoxyqueuosine(34) reductase QueG [Pseudomonadota bacterium]